MLYCLLVNLLLFLNNFQLLLHFVQRNKNVLISNYFNAVKKNKRGGFCMYDGCQIVQSAHGIANTTKLYDCCPDYVNESKFII